MDRTPDYTPAPPDLIEALEASEADLAAGRVVPGEVVRARLRETIAEMEAEEAERQATGLNEAAPER
jgi:hypothetical protein